MAGPEEWSSPGVAPGTEFGLRPGCGGIPLPAVVLRPPAAAHVAIDVETGQVAVLDYRVVEELGRVLNPMLAEGQAVGAAVQGIGGALFDRIRHDGDGQLLTANLADYLVPASVEIPRIETVALETHPATSNPLGFKGAGEGGVIAVGAAIANAIALALGTSGAGPTELPASPGDVLGLHGGAREINLSGAPPCAA